MRLRYEVGLSYLSEIGGGVYPILLRYSDRRKSLIEIESNR